MDADKLLKRYANGKITGMELQIHVEEQEARKELRKLAIKDLLSTIPGENTNREGLLETPDRVARMYDEIFGGYEMDPAELLSKTFAVDSVSSTEMGDIYKNGIVVVKDIPFYSHCEHHMVPFIGKASVAYIPGERVVGLSKIARLVDGYARRLQIQERMCNEIADALSEYLQPVGVMVVVQAEHLCMAMRGIKKPGASTVTSAIRGVFVNDMAARSECLSLIELSK